MRKCREPGVSVAATALAHGLNTNLVRKWLQQQPLAVSPPKMARPTVLLPVTVSATSVARTAKAVASAHRQQVPSEGHIDIEMNGAHIRVQGAVDGATLCCVLAMLRQQ